MRKLVTGLSVAALAGAMVTAGLQAPVGAAPAAKDTPAASKATSRDDRPSPLSDRQRAERKAAVEKVARGKATVDSRGGSRVVKLSAGRYVELSRETTDKIFVILAEFGDQVDRKYRGTPGPLHNQITQPDRTVDNNTIWQADYNRAHYADLYFSPTNENSMARYYQAQSSGRYSVDGTVSDWVKVPYNEAYYGSNDAPEGDAATWKLVRDAVDLWVADQLAAGQTVDQVKATLASYDTHDRYDFDGDGNFAEADGYIDHFQIVHAGVGEETGGGAQGADAIWSHRWYAYYNGGDGAGPSYNPVGGTQIGDTGIWVGDYTIQPENGGLGVFAHEYGHDLGLPDHYDTSYTGEASSAFWTLMASGSYLGDGSVNGIGTRPGDLSAWDKLQLGWLKYDTAKAGVASTHTVGPAEFTSSKAAQGLVVQLPDKERVVTLGTPADGAAYWSGKGDDLKNTMTLASPIALPAGSRPSLSYSTWYDIEAGYDYAYTEVSTDKSTWTRLSNRLTGRDGGIDGVSGGWTTTSFDLSQFAGKSVYVRFLYQTDGGVAQNGFEVDNIAVSAGRTSLFSDSGTTPGNWVMNGFQTTDGQESSWHPTFYVAENRTYAGFDTGLQTGPYNFGFLDSKPEWVEHFPYQDGLLISYWDASQTDNNVGEHPGEGLMLPIDAHPVALKWSDGATVRTRIQVYDATFGLQPTDAITLHRNSVATSFPSLPAQPAFDDTLDWFSGSPGSGVKVRNAGVTITVTGQSGNVMSVAVGTK